MYTSGESQPEGGTPIGALTELNLGRRRFLISAGGAAAALLAPGWLDRAALAHGGTAQVTLGSGEVLLDAVTHRNQLWSLVQTPSGVVLRTPVGSPPPFPTGFQAESLGRFAGHIIVGGHRRAPLQQSFVEGDYASLVATVGLPGLVDQPGLDRWPTEGTYEFVTNELIPATVMLHRSGWSSPVDVVGLADVAGSVTSIIGGTDTLHLVVDSLLDSSVRDSTVELLEVTVSTRQGWAERSHVATTTHGASNVLGQADDKTYVLASSLDGQEVIEVGDGQPQAVELDTELTPLSVAVDDGGPALFVETVDGSMGSLPLDEVTRRNGDIGDHLEEATVGRRSFGEDVVLMYALEGEGS